jgi:hypothetical protein
VVVFLGAHFERNELVCRCAGRGLTSRDEVWSWSTHSVFDYVGDEEREDHAYEPSEYGDVCFVGAGADEDGPKDQYAERDGTGVDEEPCLGSC